LIEWLTNWLKEIILVILLATFVDLLLPSSTMHRYVKVVLSLLILLTILSPVLSLLRADFPLSALASEKQLSRDHSAEMPPLSAVVAEGETLSAARREQELSLAERRAEEWLLAEVPKNAPVQVAGAEVKAGFNKQQLPEISSVTLAVRPAASGEREKAKDLETAAPVQPVAPVEVAVRREQGEAEVDSEPVSAQADEAVLREVQTFIARSLGLPLERVNVESAPEAGQ
jgi:stage III sporulation protein AF